MEYAFMAAVFMALIFGCASAWLWEVERETFFGVYFGVGLLSFFAGCLWPVMLGLAVLVVPTYGVFWVARKAFRRFK